MPPYQKQFLSTHANAFGGCNKRAAVDVSAAAEFSVGQFGGAIAEYDSVDGWVAVVGTSAASPMVAGLFTRLGLIDAISGNMGWVYDNMSAFNDVTSGNNDLGGGCTSILCKAGTGWDGPTGVGTPNAPALVALVGVPDAGAGGGDGGSNDASLPGNKGGCGCTTAASRESGPLLLALGGIFAAFALRRRLS
jgi:MYXO-CTERM domain-containing protein